MGDGVGGKYCEVEAGREHGGDVLITYLGMFRVFCTSRRVTVGEG